MRIDLSDVQICILVKNEEPAIESCLITAAPQFSRFVMLDQSSTDKTVTIARDILGSRVDIIHTTPSLVREVGFCGLRNILSDAATLPWILHIDADEQVIEDIIAIEIATEDGDRDLGYASISRRNLAQFECARFPLDPSVLNHLEATSVESHTRLYRSNIGFRWHSFIHEELWDPSARLPYTVPASNILINHFSSLKGLSCVREKEDFYAWMMIKGSTFAPASENALSDYARAHLEDGIEYFKERSTVYALRNALPTFQDIA